LEENGQSEEEKKKIEILEHAYTESEEMKSFFNVIKKP